jgi:hypothetical protein
MNFIEAFLKNFLIAAIISSKSFDPLNKVGLSYVPFSNQVALVQSIPLSDSKIEGCLISISDERMFSQAAIRAATYFRLNYSKGYLK